MSTKATADKLLGKKFGVFTHFLKHDRPEGWSATVDGFDVPTLAKSLKEINAGWYFITLMQGRKFMCSPNAAFDEIAGTKPGEACSLRDLPADIIAALDPLGIDFCLYYTGDGPYKDEPIGKRFGYIEPRQSQLNRGFIANWARVLEEYAVRYGDKVNAWWIDGCYRDFRYNEELLQPYVDACHKGNPNALVSMNDGVKDILTRDFANEDMTCGEYTDFVYIPEGRYVDGVQAHILAPLGVSPDPVNCPWDTWCRGGSKRSKEYMADFVRRANEHGCLVTIDVGIDEFGHIDENQLETLRYVGEHV